MYFFIFLPSLPPFSADIDISIPFFEGQGYLAYNSLTNTFASTLVTMSIRPASPDGLLLLNQQANGRDYIAVVLRNGHVEFWYDLGSGAVSLMSTDVLELDVWHMIEVYRSGRSGHLIIDSSFPVSGESPGNLNALQLGDPLFIGGVDAASSDSVPDEIQVGGYVGCVRDVLIGSSLTPLSLISDTLSGAGVERCQCTVNSCLNNGFCYVLEEANREECFCSLPFTGQNCSESKLLDLIYDSTHQHGSLSYRGDFLTGTILWTELLRIHS